MQFLPEIIGSLILGFALGAQLRLRSFLWEQRRKIAVVGGLSILVGTLFLAWMQYNAWRIDPVSQFLLPPHQGIAYFVLYIGRRLILPWVIAAVAGFLGMILAQKLNARFENRFFEDEEPFIFGLAIFGVGYPTLLLYIILVFWIGIIITAWYAVSRKGRAPLYYIWLPTALFAILLKSLIFNKSFWGKFNF